MHWYLGTMGFSYNDWSGPFYPSYVDARDYLAYYTQYFNAVEIDSTFYGTPRPEVVEHWAESVPEGFKICAKLPKAITHELELIGVEGLTGEFLHTIRLLGDRLGVILIQFPPSFNIEKYEDLDRFLGGLPQDLRYAVEIRHRSWYSDVTERLFRKHRVAWAITEYEELPIRLVATADFVYFRLIGVHGRFARHDRMQIDVTKKLEWWQGHLEPLAHEVETTFGFFNNDYAGFSPATANQFKEIAGLPLKPLEPPQQPRLF